MPKSSTAKRLQYNSSWCKDCGICAAFCPKGVLKMIHGKLVIADEPACISCNTCGRMCPDYAIYCGEEDEA